MVPSSGFRRRCRIISYLTSCLAFSLVGLCTSEALVVPSSTSSFLPRSLWGTRGGSQGTKVPPPSPLKCVVLQAPVGSSTSSTSKALSSSSRGDYNGESQASQQQQQQPPPQSNGKTQPPITNGQSKEETAAALIDLPIPAEYIAETKLPTDVGHFQLRAYRVKKGSNEHMGTEPCVIYCANNSPFGGDANNGGELSQNVPVRIHDQCLTSEVFRSQRCDCKEQLKMSLKYIQKHGGAIIYLQQEGRGIGLANKVAAYALQDVGLDTVDANLHLGFAEDCRQYGVVPSILADMGIGSIRLMTNNPRKVNRLIALGVDVVDTVPVVVPQANPYNRKYLETKIDRMEHSNLSPLFKNGMMVASSKTKTTATATNNNNQKESPSDEAEETTYVTDGEEMCANAVHISLMNNETMESSSSVTFATDTTTDNYDSQLGVTASEDGYCFGRQSVEDAVDAMAQGKMVVVVDDMDRENEGDFIMAADLCTPKDMATIIRYSSGVICIAMEGSRMDALQLPAMVTNNEDPKETAFSVSVDATKEHGITTGISATDRALTVQLLANPQAKATDFARPGHIFPLRAREGGVLERDGHTEAAVDLSVLAGRAPVGILCEIVSEENPVEMARLPELRRFCDKHGYVLTSIVDIAQYRREKELIKKLE